LKNGITGFFKAGHDMIAELHEQVNQLAKKSGDDETGEASDKIGMKERAVLENAMLEIPRMMVENGKSRTVQAKKEYDLLMKAVDDICRSLSS
jgi:hypothetical protein